MSEKNSVDAVLKFREVGSFHAIRGSDEQLRKNIELLDAKISSIQFIRQEAGILHNPFEWGYTLYSYIKAGDAEGVVDYYCRERDWIPGMPAEDSLRYSKNMAIMVFAVITNFSALDKLVDHEYCFTVSDACAQLVEEAESREEVHGAVMAGLYKFACMVQDYRQKGYHPLINRAKDYISKNFHQELTVRQIASELSVSPEHLTRVFGKVEGCTVKEYIQATRVRQIKQLLQFSDISISDISRYMGFSSQSYMTEVFRRATGFTPKQYRDQFLEQNK